MLLDGGGGVFSGVPYLAIMSAIFEAGAIVLAVVVDRICERNGDSLFSGLTL